MGSMADYYIELGMNQGWNPVGRDRPFVRSNKHDVTCKKCGAKDLKWRAEEGRWRLYENERTDHNRLLEHQCSRASASDFDEVSDGD